MHDFQLIGEGRNRLVYRRGNFVVKVPKNNCGVLDNHREYHIFSSTTDGWLFGLRYARCRLMKPNYCLLVMEYVIPYQEPLDKLPLWTYSVDCAQVGYNRKGHLVAYDYGIC